MTDLGTLGGVASWAFGINARGQIVGTSYMASGSSTHGFLWGPVSGAMTDLDTLGDDYSEAYRINAGGQVVGTSQTASGDYHATVWTPIP